MTDSELAAIRKAYMYFDDNNQGWYEQTLGPSKGTGEIQIVVKSQLVPGMWLGTGSIASAFDYWFAHVRGDEQGSADDRDHDGSPDDLQSGTARDDVLSTAGGIDIVRAGKGNDRIFAGSGNDYIAGEDGDDILNGGSGNDEIFGGNGNDDLQGGAGNNILDGGAGIDIARVDFATIPKINKTATGYLLENSSGGMDTLIAIERIDLGTGSSIALDVDASGHAGQAMGLIGVVAPAFLDNAVIRGRILSLFDQGQTMEALCQQALDLQLVPKFNNLVLANTVHYNVTGRRASQAMSDELVDYIDAHGQVGFLSAVAAMHVNVDLVGLQQTGLYYSNIY